jgi:hypothetical protein
MIFICVSLLLLLAHAYVPRRQFRIVVRSRLFNDNTNTTIFNSEMRSLEELIFEASQEKNEADRLNKEMEVARRKKSLRKKADKEYDAYWDRQAAVGGLNKEQATYNGQS